MRLTKNHCLMDQLQQCTDELIQNVQKSLTEFGESSIMVELIKGLNLTFASGDAKDSLRRVT